MINLFTSDDLHDIVDALAAAVDAKDPYTYGHSARVAEISLAIAQAMGLTKDEQYKVHIGAHLHDVGKIGIPDAVLTKPGRLTEEEFELIRQHSAIGYTIVKKVKILEPIADIVRHHHERIDGRGYPDALKGEEISLGARIVAVADAFDAMTSKRTYRIRVSYEEAITELERCAGAQFDPRVVSAFATIIRSGAFRLSLSA